MKSTVETLGPTRVRLAIEVPFAELEPTVRKAYREVSQQVNIPGFRRGKVPAAVIDQRVGRGVVLNEAMQEIIPQQVMLAIREHEVKTLTQPEVGNLEFEDGQPLKFTAEMDVRPELTLPDLSQITVTVDELQVSEEDIDERVNGLRDRFATLKTVERPAASGDYVQIDLQATVDGQEIEGGSATNVSHEVGSGKLLDGLDEVLVGMSAGDQRSFVSPLAGGEFAGRDADVSVTVRTVKEKELPELDDDFAQMASEFDTLTELREDMRGGIRRLKRMEQIYAARDQAVAELVRLAEVPTPEGMVRDEVQHRKGHISSELERAGRSLADYLRMEGQTEEEIDAELTESATQAIRIQIVLDVLAEAENIQVSDEEYGQQIVRMAQQAGVEPQQYYEQLRQSGAAASVAIEVRRNKALGRLLESVTITDTAGNPVTLDEPSAVDAEATGEADGQDQPAAGAL